MTGHHPGDMCSVLVSHHCATRALALPSLLSCTRRLKRSKAAERLRTELRKGVWPEPKKCLGRSWEGSHPMGESAIRMADFHGSTGKWLGKYWREHRWTLGVGVSVSRCGVEAWKLGFHLQQSGIWQWPIGRKSPQICSAVDRHQFINQGPFSVRKFEVSSLSWGWKQPRIKVGVVDSNGAGVPKKWIPSWGFQSWLL